MLNDSMNTTTVRLLLPETLWLEPEYFEQARTLSNRFSDERQQWQAYLNGLGRLAFASWLQERLANHHPIHPGSHEFADVCYLTMGDFKLCLIATEQVLDELVSVPRRVVEQPDCVAHLYVVVEVLEEQEQVVVRGFLRYDELVNQANQITASDECCVSPLSAFDAEIDHLIVYIQYLAPSAITIPIAAAQPQVSSQQIEVSSLPTISGIRTRLSQWLQGVLDEGWQTIETLIDPDVNLAWSTRHRFSGAKGGKLINLGMQLGEQTVVLLVTVTPENEGKIGVNIQVLPAAGTEVLPAQLKLTLLSKMGKILQQVQSRAQDNYIQLKPFKGKPGAGFSVEVSCNDICVREAFEL